MRRFMAYGYRDLSDSDLKHLLAYLESTPGQRYVTAYNAAMDAGFDAMGRRTGEQLGESLRELAQAQMAPPAREGAAPVDRRPASRVTALDEFFEEGAEQQANRADLVFQPVVRIEQVQGGAMLPRPAHTVVHRHDIVMPAMNDGRGTGNIPRRVGFRSRACRTPAPEGTPPAV